MRENRERRPAGRPDSARLLALLGRLLSMVVFRVLRPWGPLVAALAILLALIGQQAGETSRRQRA